MNRSIQTEDIVDIDDGMEIMMPTEEAIEDPKPEEQQIKPEPEPEKAPAEQSEPSKKKQYQVPFQSMLVDPDAVIEFGEGKYRIPLAMVNLFRGVGGGTLNEPFEIAMLRNHGSENLEHKYEDQMALSFPLSSYIDRCAVPGSKWTNNVIVGDGKSTRPSAVRPKHDDLVSIFAANNQLGQPTKWTFHNVGIVVYMRPALDSELINLEMLLLEERANVGMSTYGTCLSADMGVHLGTLIDFALGLVTWTNIEHDGNIASALRTHLRGRESIDVLLAATLASMYPHGFPWSITCSSAECAFTEVLDIFFARCQWTDMSRLTDKCLNILHRNSTVLTEDNYKLYVEELASNQDKFVHGNSTFNLIVPTIADYAASTRRWVNNVEKENSEALARIDNENMRTAYLDSQKASRSLLQYSHYVSSIDIEHGGVISTITDREAIEQILHQASSDFELAVKFAGAVADFELMSRTTMIGYLNRNCPTCNNTLHTEDHEIWKSIVPLPVDRIFFMHMQLKTQILRGIPGTR